MDNTPTPNQSSAVPSAAAMRATRALQKENGRRLLAREEFLTQEEIAAIIDEQTGVKELVEAARLVLNGELYIDHSAACTTALGPGHKCTCDRDPAVKNLEALIAKHERNQ